MPDRASCRVEGCKFPAFFDDGDLCQIHLLENAPSPVVSDPFADLGRMGGGVTDSTVLADRAAAANEHRAAEFTAANVPAPEVVKSKSNKSRPAIVQADSTPKE